MPDNAAQGTAVSVRQTSEVGQFQRQLEARARDIQMALPAHISFDKFQRTLLTAVAANPELLKADRQSLILSVYKAAQDALLLDGREATVVTFNTRFKDPGDGQWKSKKVCQYLPMVYGLRKKILQSGDVVSLEVNVIYRSEVEKGTFLYEVGLEPPLRHRPSLDLTEAETSDEQIIGAYSIATMKDGTKSYEIMRRFEINKVRQVSQTGATGRTDRQGKPIEPKGPWVDWFAEMAKKTVMRRHAKTLPMSGDLLIDVEGRELETAGSIARALGSTAPDEPTLITDESGDMIDTETGEVVSEADGEATEPQKLPEEAAAETQPRRGRGKASAEGNAPATSATAQSSDARVSTANGETTSSNGQTATTAASPSDDRDELGVTRDRQGEELAEKLLGEFADAKTEADLKKLWDGSELERASMSDDIHDAVANGYHRHEKRLREAEPAGAK